MRTKVLGWRSRTTASWMSCSSCPRVLAAFAFLACQTAADDRDRAVPRVPEAAERPANEFDPATVVAGDTVVGLVVEEIRRERTPSGVWVGSARFSGERLLHGRTFAHPDGADYPFPCVELDTASARTLPRWAGDERRPWFCFEKPEDARARIGPAAPSRPLSIRIDRFTIHRNLTDAVNSARLIAVVTDRSSRDSIAGWMCFADTQSVLGRRPGSAAPGPPGLDGWIRVDTGSAADSGLGTLIDSDGRSLEASWRRVARDSVLIDAFNDFLRIEMRLAIDDRTATGIAVARSDAVVQRDSAGRPTGFERRWPVSARRAPCERLPGGDGGPHPLRRDT